MEAFENLTRILVVRLAGIGDVIMLAPAVRVLRRAFPKAQITLLVSRAGAAAAGLLAEVDEVFVHRALWQEARQGMPFNPAREQDFINELRRRDFEAAFLFTSFFQSPFPSAYACYLAGIPLRIAQSQAFGGGLLTHWVRPLPDSAHQVDRNLQLLKEVGIPVGGPGATALRVVIGQDVQTGVDTLLRARGVRGGFVVIAPGATCTARCYPLARYIDVAARLQETGHRVVVVGGSRDQAAGDAIVAAVPGAVSLCGWTTLADLAALLRRARLLITNDSGPMHIGDAVACPMVILYSGSELKKPWRPRGAPAHLLRRPTACSPCYRSECPYDRECLAIAPADVVGEVMGLLGETVREVADG